MNFNEELIEYQFPIICIFKLKPSTMHSIQGIRDLPSAPAPDTFQVFGILYVASSTLSQSQWPRNCSQSAA
jgi:hypothetical protein